MKIPLDVLSRFAFSMATCLGAGLLPRKALDLSAEVGGSGALRRAAHAAADACDQGMLISDGLEENAGRLPHFVVPLIRAGETSGHQVEAFQLLHAHCQRLKPALDLVRQTWLYPLVCVTAGWLIRLLILLYFGRYALAGRFFRDTFVNAAIVAIVILLVCNVPMARALIDRLMLQLPVIRETVLREAATLFFSTFQLVYDAGGLSVVNGLLALWLRRTPPLDPLTH